MLYLHKVFLLITTPKSNLSKQYKHFRKGVAFSFGRLELFLHFRSRAGSFLDFFPDSGFGTYVCHVDHHGDFIGASRTRFLTSYFLAVL